MKLKVDEIIGHIGGALTEEEKKRGILIQALQTVQEEYNYLPEEGLKMLSEKLDISLTDVYSTASFYKQFYFTPRGKNIVRVCTGTACHVIDTGKTLEVLKEEFNIESGETAPDLSVSLETVSCVGCCAIAPVVVVNEEIIGALTPRKTLSMVDEIRAGAFEGRLKDEDEDKED